MHAEGSRDGGLFPPHSALVQLLRNLLGFGEGKGQAAALTWHVGNSIPPSSPLRLVRCILPFVSSVKAVAGTVLLLCAATSG